MATCLHCGCELHGQYCDMCGAKAPEGVSTHKLRQQRAAGSPRPRQNESGFAQRQSRIWWRRALLGLTIFGGGLLVGLGMAASSVRPAALPSQAPPQASEMAPGPKPW